jgi:hypothetical protein
MSDIVKEAGERYREAIDATRTQRKQIEEDLAFTDPSEPAQWDEAEKRQRETDPGGARPCLVFDQVGQYISNVAGQVEQRPPAIHAIPVTGGAVKKVAENLDGFFRHIEHTSRAQQHYATALTSAARAGVGYLIVRPEYTDRALGYQEPRISSEGDPLRVVLDPFSVEKDGSDATFGQLLTPMSHREFERRWKGADKVSFGDKDYRTVDERQEILTAEEWRLVDETVNMIFCVDLAAAQASMQQGVQPEVFALPEDEFWEAQKQGRVVAQPDSAGRQNYTDKRRSVKWVRLSGAGVLDKEVDYPASGIGIVPVYGYVGHRDGRITYCGMGRRARSAQQSYNFHQSEIRVLLADIAKSPWLMPESALAGQDNLKRLWDRASVERRAYLPYVDWDDTNQRAIPAPIRTSLSLDLRNHIIGSDRAERDIQASLGMYQANLGAPSNESSGIAIESRKQQGEASTANFPSHLAASLGQVGKLCVEMTQRLIDTRRQVRILGLDSTPGHVTIDPKGEAVKETPQGISINPNVGKYDVRVVIGASFSTQRQQAQAAYTEMTRANPQLMPAIGPLWAQTLDVPNADKLAQVLTAVAPPEVRAILQPEKQQATTEQLTAEVQQLKAALQEAIQHAQESMQECAELQAKAEAKDDENAIKAFDAWTKRMQSLGSFLTPEQVQQMVLSLVPQTLEQMLSHPAPLPGDDQLIPTGEATELPPMDMPHAPEQPPAGMPPVTPEPPAPLGEPQPMEPNDATPQQ